MESDIERRDIFPLERALEAKERRRQSQSKPSAGRARKYRREALERAVVQDGISSALNHLAEGYVGLQICKRDKLIESGNVRKPNAAHHMARQYLADITDLGIRRGMFPRSDTREQIAVADYTCLEDRKRTWLEPELLSLPADGIAG